MALSLIDRINNMSNKTYTQNSFGNVLYGGVSTRDQLAYNKSGVALAYMRVQPLKTSVDLIAQAISAIPIQIVDNKGTVLADSREYTNQSPTLEYIENAYRDQQLPLFQLWALDLLLYGEAYIAKESNEFQFLKGLSRLNPLGTYPIIERGEITSYNYSGAYGNLLLPANRVIYSRGFHPFDDIQGYSASLAALGAASIVLEFNRFTLSFYANQGHPAMILSPKDKDLTKQQTQDLAALWRDTFRGADAFFKPYLSQFPFDTTVLETPDITQPLAVSEYAERIIYRAFGIPPALLGSDNKSTISSSGEAVSEVRRAFILNAVEPIARQIETALNASGLVEYWDGVGKHLRFDFSDYTRSIEVEIKEQSLAQAKYLSGAISLGTYQETLGEIKQLGSDNVYAMAQGYIVYQGLPPTGSTSPVPDVPKSLPATEDSPDPEPIKAVPVAYRDIDFKPTETMRDNARRGLEWRREYNRGGTGVGVARARDISSGRTLSPETVRRMYSYFSRHEVDKQALGFESGEDGFPSAGRIAWELWGGDAGFSWSRQLVNRMDRADKSIYIDDLRKWRKKIKNAKSASVWFNPDNLPDYISAYIRDTLTSDSSPDDINQTFTKAENLLDLWTDDSIESALDMMRQAGIDLAQYEDNDNV